jgi:hypothetical protein
MILFIVKTIHVSIDDEDDVYWEDSSDAVYFDVKSAYDNVRFNWGDLCEAGYNQYAVILATKGGLYPTSDELAWYRWNKETNEYEQCDRPEFMDGIGFSL